MFAVAMLIPTPHRAAAPRMSSPAFPEGFDPNYFPADTRTYAGAIAKPPMKDGEIGVCVKDDSPMGEVECLLPTFDFDTSTETKVAEVEAAVFECLEREAAALTGSWLTSSLVQRCVLKHTSLPDALAVLLSGKVHETLPGALAYSTAGGSRAESATAEEALRETMARRLSEPAVRRAIVSDLLKVIVVDPAADGLLQPYLFFKGFHALATHRVAHSLWLDGSAASQGAALLLQSRCAELFSVDIHPAATIGNGVMLDHASGIVIGSTAIVGSDVYMLHGVTLGATGKPTGGRKRHPTVGSRVVLGAGSAVLGDVRVGDGCTVGASAIVTKEVPDGATVIGVNNVVKRADAQKKADEKQEQLDDFTWYYTL